MVRAGKPRDHGAMTLPPFPFADGGLLPPDGHIVTSSILVRHFGVWGERAGRSPVTILQHGRPRHILVGIEQWNALLASAAAPAPTTTTVEILDAISDLVVAADAAGGIIATSRTARAHFGGRVDLGRRLDGIVPEADRATLQDALHSVSASGREAALLLRSIARPGRTIRWVVVPQQAGIAMIARDDPAVLL